MDQYSLEIRKIEGDFIEKDKIIICKPASVSKINMQLDSACMTDESLSWGIWNQGHSFKVWV